MWLDTSKESTNEWQLVVLEDSLRQKPRLTFFRYASGAHERKFDLLGMKTTNSLTGSGRRQCLYVSDFELKAVHIWDYSGIPMSLANYTEFLVWRAISPFYCS